MNLSPDVTTSLFPLQSPVILAYLVLHMPHCAIFHPLKRLNFDRGPVILGNASPICPRHLVQFSDPNFHVVRALRTTYKVSLPPHFYCITRYGRSRARRYSTPQTNPTTFFTYPSFSNDFSIVIASSGCSGNFGAAVGVK